MEGEADIQSPGTGIFVAFRNVRVGVHDVLVSEMLSPDLLIGGEPEPIDSKVGVAGLRKRGKRKAEIIGKIILIGADLWWVLGVRDDACVNYGIVTVAGVRFHRDRRTGNASEIIASRKNGLRWAVPF